MGWWSQALVQDITSATSCLIGNYNEKNIETKQPINKHTFILYRELTVQCKG